MKKQASPKYAPEVRERAVRMRETISYLVHGARALMDGGYRGLLKPPKRRRDE